jgi:hypothetical protein
MLEKRCKNTKISFIPSSLGVKSRETRTKKARYFHSGRALSNIFYRLILIEEGTLAFSKTLC